MNINEAKRGLLCIRTHAKTHTHTHPSDTHTPNGRHYFRPSFCSVLYSNVRVRFAGGRRDGGREGGGINNLWPHIQITCSLLLMLIDEWDKSPFRGEEEGHFKGPGDQTDRWLGRND